MSAAAEYYGYLLSQGYDEYQLKQFSNFASRANRGEISHNQAYRLALKAGFKGTDSWSNEDGTASDESKKKNFASWMKTAQDAGWIDKGLGALDSLLNKNKKNKDIAIPPPPPKKDYTLAIVIGVVGLGIVGATIYYFTRKK